ncbi:MAG: signal peptidase II [Bacteroidetes bacterium]|nr:signal peptidase II [Bacteroidota bacterium]MBU1113645.1 signal peptidase II [Bacteroidota bacterium]MBU1796779.1 signal peptidase II [Bacteroidota bacterium]
MKILYVTLAVFLTDQASKLAVKGFSIPFLNINWEGMDYGQSINVIGNFLRITFVENSGMAFGFEVGIVQKFFLTIFTFLAAIGLFYYLYKSQKRDFPLRLGLALILAGALGNLIDRAFYGIIFDYAPLLYGRVVDFIQVEFWDFTLFGNTYETWPIFNVADSAVTVGVAIILLFHRENAIIENTETDEVTDKISTVAENNINNNNA